MGLQAHPHGVSWPTASGPWYSSLTGLWVAVAGVGVAPAGFTPSVTESEEAGLAVLALGPRHP